MTNEPTSDGIQLTDQPIDAAALLGAVGSTQAGAVVLFLGTARELTDGRQTASLDYEAFAPMARRKMAELKEEACRRWPVTACAIVHRVGRIELAEASVAVAVSTPHREDAFQAAKWLIDTLKVSVPIWKKENWADGSSQWVHPGMKTGRMD